MAGKPRLRPEQELAILQACADGFTDEQIARHHNVSERTVRRVILRLMESCRAKNRINLVAIAVASGKVRPIVRA